jgi:hypothetical protein
LTSIGGEAAFQHQEGHHSAPRRGGGAETLSIGLVCLGVVLGIFGAMVDCV